MNLAKIKTEIKKYLSIPTHPTFKRYGWNVGTKNIFDGHSLVTWENFDAFLNGDIVYEVFDAEAAYELNQIITLGDKYYRVIEAIAADSTSTINNGKFQETTPTYELIESLINRSIDELLDTWEQNIKLETTNGKVIEQVYGSIDTYNKQEINDNQEYGLRIDVHPNPNTSINLNKLLVYSSAVKTGVQIEILDNNGNSETITTNLEANKVNEILCDFTTYSDALEVRITNDSFLAITGITKVKDYMTIKGLSNGIETYTEYGIAANVTYQCDYSNIICQNISSFLRPLINQFAVTALEYFAYNPHSNINRNENNINKEDMIYELDKARDAGGISLRGKLFHSIKSIGADFFPKDGTCVGCSIKSSVSWSNM